MLPRCWWLHGSSNSRVLLFGILEEPSIFFELISFGMEAMMTRQENMEVGPSTIPMVFSYEPIQSIRQRILQRRKVLVAHLIATTTLLHQGLGLNAQLVILIDHARIGAGPSCGGSTAVQVHQENGHKGRKALLGRIALAFAEGQWQVHGRTRRTRVL